MSKKQQNAQQKKKRREARKARADKQANLKLIRTARDSYSVSQDGGSKLFSQIQLHVPETLQERYGRTKVEEAVAAVIETVDAIQNQADNLKTFAGVIASRMYGGFNLVYLVASQKVADKRVRGIILGSAISFTTHEGLRDVIDPYQIYIDNGVSNRYDDDLAYLIDYSRDEVVDSKK